MKVLTTDTSSWDDTASTVGGSFWRKFKGWLDGQDISSVFLEHQDAQRTKWDEALAQKDIIFISHCGHGNYSTITGYGLNILAKVGAYDPKLYEGLGLSFLSCQCGKNLINDMCGKGCLFGTGYKETYYFYYSGVKPPCDDPMSKSFLDTHLLGDKLMLQGKTGAEAFQSVNDEYTNQANLWREENPDVAAMLLYDRDIHVYHGDGNWTPKEEPMPEVIVKVFMTKKVPATYDVKFEVKDKNTDDPINGAEILFDNTERTTDANGEAWFRDTPSGTYSWKATHEEYEPEEGTVQLD